MASSAREETLEQLLDHYRQSGVESEGHFTLNPARAREMLKQFQLPEPAYAALHLTSFLVGAGATSISVERRSGGLVFVAPGAQVPPEAMSSPFSALLKSRVEPFLSELALGLNAVLGQQATVEMASGSRVARYTPDQIEIVEGKPAPAFSLALSVGGERELELVCEHFALCPTPIAVSGRSIASPDPWSPATLQVSLESHSYPLPVLPSCPLSVSKSSRAPFSAAIRVGREVSGARVLHLGRLYTVGLPWTSGLRGWQVEVVLNTDRLQKDLTQQTLRDTETLKNLFATLRQQLETALLTLPLSVWQDDESQALWDSVIELLGRTRTAEAMARQMAFLRVLATIPNGLEKANAMTRLGLLQNMAQAGSGAGSLHAAETILAQMDPWQASCVSLKARMDLARPTPELERAVQTFASDPRACSEDRLQACRWLRERRRENPSLRADYTCRLARQLQQMQRPGLALAELDSEDEVISADKRLLASSLEVRAGAQADLGHYERALESLGRLLDLQREEHGQYSLHLGLTLTRMAALLEHLGKGKQAREYRDWSHRLFQ